MDDDNGKDDNDEENNFLIQYSFTEYIHGDHSGGKPLLTGSQAAPSGVGSQITYCLRKSFFLTDFLATICHVDGKWKNASAHRSKTLAKTTQSDIKLIQKREEGHREGPADPIWHF